MKRRLQPLLDKVANNGPFCTDPDATVTIHIDPSDYNKLHVRQYHIPHSLMHIVHETLTRWREQGKVKLAPPGTQFNQPLLVAPKFDKEGRVSGVRVVLDARRLNKLMRNDDRFQLSHIPDVLERFRGNSLFGEFDLSEAYFQFPVAEESQKYLAFTIDNQQYMFTAAAFGIKHLPSHFQRFMAKLFHDMPFVFPYIDNLPFASKNWEEHEMHARMILERLDSVGLKIKASATDFGHSQIRILGHLIDADGIHIDPDKKQAILDWPQPRSGAEMAAFLGLAGYLSDHIRHYADIAAPLIALKKQQEIEWTPNLVDHFNLLKRAFATAPFLKYPDLNKRFVIAHDASLYGVGGVLYQPDDDNDSITPYNIVDLCSKKLNDVQTRYPVYKKELWGLIYCLRRFHSYIYLRSDTVVYTDHKPLIHILNQEQLSVALQQWLDVLLNYNLKIKYRPGILHVVPDALSRMYLSAYEDSSVAWGTKSTIDFVRESFRNDSPSDTLCEQSLIDAAPKTTTKRRHRIVTVKRATSSALSSTSSTTPSVVNNAMRVEIDNDKADDDDNAPAVLVHEDDYYQYGQSLNVVERIDEDTICEWNVADEYGQMVNAVSTRAHAYEQSVANRQRSEAAQHNKRMLTNAPPLRDSDIVPAATSTAPSSSTTNNGYHHAPTTTTTQSQSTTTASAPPAATSPTILTAEERLALAHEKRGRVVPPQNEWKAIIQRAHSFGHFGVTAIYRSILNDGYWWSGMRQHIQKVVDDCHQCRQYNIQKRGYHPARSVHASQPGDHFIIDLMEVARSTDGRTHMLVVVDAFTGFIFIRALEDKDATTIARHLWEVISIVGPPKVVQSDQGSEFVNGIIAALTQLMGVEHGTITPYHPAADARVERPIQVIRNTINKMLEGDYRHWPLYVSFVQLAYNVKISEITGSSPFSLLFGRQFNKFIDYTGVQIKHIDLNDWKRHQQDIMSLVYPAVELHARRARHAYIEQLDKARQRVLQHSLPVGTKVYINNPTYLGREHTRPKDAPRYVGPYFIVKRVNNGPYILRDQDGHEYERRVPIDQIQFRKLPPSLEQDTREWEVEKILEHRGTGDNTEYKVKWKGFPLSQSTWVNKRDLNAPALIRKWHRQRALQHQAHNVSSVDAHELILSTDINNAPEVLGIKSTPSSSSSSSSSSTSSSPSVHVSFIHLI